MKQLSALVPATFLFAVAGCTLFSCQAPEPSRPVHQLDLSSIDSSVRPQDNFFLYANGGWIRKAEIPASQSFWGTLAQLNEQITSNTESILDSISKLYSAKGSIEQKVGDLYASGMDSLTIEKLGIGPVKPELEAIAAVRDVDGLEIQMAREYQIGHFPLFSFYVSADEKNSGMMAAHFDQGGLGLPNKDYYFSKDSSIKKIKVSYQEYIKTIFQFIGDDSARAARNAADVVQLETGLAKMSRSPVALRDPNANYHKLAVSDLGRVAPGLNWKSLLSNLGVTTDTIIMGQPEYFGGAGKLLHALLLEHWKNYLRFHVVDDYAPYLSKDFVSASFGFNKMLNGRKEMRERWKRMNDLVDNNLGDALGRLYVQRYFPPEAKQRMSEMVSNLMQTYEERIKALDWMSDSTKQKALTKLHSIVRKIGYPDKWRDYSTVTIVRDSLIANLVNCDRYAYHRNLNKIGKPVDKSEWYMTPPTLDAYYNPTTNDINFPAGILQPPIFSKDADDALNYGGIGMVIGHEMTHGFDDQGRQFDASGNLKDWWSKEDAAKFKQRADLAVDQYNHYIAVDTFHINGSLGLGENIADIGGVAIAYAAFKKTAEGKSTERIDGLTPDQRFFLSAATVWKMKYRDEVLRTQVMNNPHSTAMYRVNGPVSNMQAFYDAFAVKPGDKMYRPDSVRVHIW
jgi:putative endopeptidase